MDFGEGLKIGNLTKFCPIQIVFDLRFFKKSDFLILLKCLPKSVTIRNYLLHSTKHSLQCGCRTCWFQASLTKITEIISKPIVPSHFQLSKFWIDFDLHEIVLSTHHNGLEMLIRLWLNEKFVDKSVFVIISSNISKNLTNPISLRGLKIIQRK